MLVGLKNRRSSLDVGGGEGDGVTVLSGGVTGPDGGNTGGPDIGGSIGPGAGIGTVVEVAGGLGVRVPLPDLPDTGGFVAPVG